MPKKGTSPTYHTREAKMDRMHRNLQGSPVTKSFGGPYASMTAKNEANRKATLKRGPVKRPKKKPTSFRDMKF